MPLVGGRFTEYKCTPAGITMNVADYCRLLRKISARARYLSHGKFDPASHMSHYGKSESIIITVGKNNIRKSCRLIRPTY